MARVFSPITQAIALHALSDSGHRGLQLIQIVPHGGDLLSESLLIMLASISAGGEFQQCICLA